MITTNLYINHYDWEVYVVYDPAPKDYGVIVELLESIHAPDDVIARIENILTPYNYDYGFTYSCPKCKKTVIVIGNFTSPEEFLNTMEHEIRHLVDDISQVYHIRPNGEEVGYLTGNINQILIDDIKDNICSCKN